MSALNQSLANLEYEARLKKTNFDMVRSRNRGPCGYHGPTMAPYGELQLWEIVQRSTY